MEETSEFVNHPAHYGGEGNPYEAIKVIEAWGLGFCLADDMGLGKTVQALAMIQRDWVSGIRKPVLVLGSILPDEAEVAIKTILQKRIAQAKQLKEDVETKGSKAQADMTIRRMEARLADLRGR